MPKFNSPEAEARWRAAMAARKGQPRKKALAVMQPNGEAAMKPVQGGGDHAGDRGDRSEDRGAGSV